MESDSAIACQVNPTVDQVISHAPQTHPTFNALGSLVAGPIQPVPPFENADAVFTAGAPLLRLLEPTLLLFLLAFFTFGGATGNGHSVHTHFFGCGFVGGGEESRVGSHQVRNTTKQFLVLFD